MTAADRNSHEAPATAGAEAQPGQQVRGYPLGTHRRRTGTLDRILDGWAAYVWTNPDRNDHVRLVIMDLSTLEVLDQASK